MFALLDNIGGAELFILALASLLIFGKRLPEVASQAGSALTKLRRGVNEAWRDTGVDQEVRKIKDALPRDLSVSGLARDAARKFEQRVEELTKTEPPADAGNAPVPDDVKNAAPEVRASASLEDGTMPLRRGPGPVGAPGESAEGLDPAGRAGTGSLPDAGSSAESRASGAPGQPDQPSEPGAPPAAPPAGGGDTVARGSLPND